MTPARPNLSDLVRITDPAKVRRELAEADAQTKTRFGASTPVRWPDAELKEMLCDAWLFEGFAGNPFLDDDQRTLVLTHLIDGYMVEGKWRGATAFKVMLNTWGEELLNHPEFLRGLRDARPQMTKYLETNSAARLPDRLQEWIKMLAVRAPDMELPALTAYFDWIWDHVRGRLPHEVELSLFAYQPAHGEEMLSYIAGRLEPDPRLIHLIPNDNAFGKLFVEQIAKCRPALAHPRFLELLLEHGDFGDFHEAAGQVRNHPSVAGPFFRALIAKDPAFAVSLLATYPETVVSLQPADFTPMLMHERDEVRQKAILLVGSLQVPEQAPPAPPRTM